MPDQLTPFREYAKAISANLARGDSTEHTHRPALKSVVQAVRAGTVATNEPRRIECGAPDYIVSTGAATIGYIEAKDVGDNLSATEKTKQLKGYLAALPNLILTDYVEFRWYTDGKLRETACLGMVADRGVRTTADSVAQVRGLLDKFLQHRAPSAAGAKELAGRMAHLARMIREVAVSTFEHEEETGTLHAQYQAFTEVLLPDLPVDQFADMFAQTIAYGLFAARASGPIGRGFTRQDAAYLLPKTNPFLRKLFGHIAGPDLDDRIAWIVDDLAQVLADADMHTILQDFHSKVRKEDPVVHFYETFLAEYDPKMREVRGVYYTPEPVVSYIVRSVDHLLKTKFDKPLGLADPNVLILDPACGTGTFLFCVVKLIYDRMVESGQRGGWNDYVEKHLLPRLYGFELLMAPYAIAHLKLGMLLEETGYEFKSDQRLGVYLTNTLEEAVKTDQALPFAGFITEEANAAAEVKRERPIMVVLGNPPYSGHSANRSEKVVEDRTTGRVVRRRVKTWIGQLVHDYYTVDGKPLGERNPKMLQDDYVKFIRFGQWRIEQTGHGILAFVTNHGYLDNPTFRGMRQHLSAAFSEISVLDLHGNAKKRETAPDGSKDENVFDIRQGVAVGLFVNEPGASPHKCRHADLWGPRSGGPDRVGKYGWLACSDVRSTAWSHVHLAAPFYPFKPEASGRSAEFYALSGLSTAFGMHGVGVATGRDYLLVAFTRAVLASCAAAFAAADAGDAEIREMFVAPADKLQVAQARAALRAGGAGAASVVPYLYRPFDFRFLLYADVLVDRPRREVMRHLARRNRALFVGRQGQAVGPGCWNLAFCGALVEDYNLFYRGNNACYPLYLYPAPGELTLHASHWPAGPEGRVPNLSLPFTGDMEKRLGMEFVTDGKGDLEETFGPEDVFDYIYAVFHSPTYRTRYAEFLKIDFPRVPLTSNKDAFRGLVEKGAELVSLHLMESPALNNLVTTYPASGSDEVEKVEYNDLLRRVCINKTQYFEGVDPEVWEFHVGGYQVLSKWLKDRKGRKLTYEDQQHYQKIVVALKETIRLTREIDETIPSWPIE